MGWRPLFISLLLAMLGSSSAMASPAAPAARELGGPPAADRGELLYATHCVECHTAQVHWRARRLARDWATLRAEVGRWQEAARLGWSDADIDAVTLHLNRTIYRFDSPQEQARDAVVRSRR